MWSPGRANDHAGAWSQIVNNVFFKVFSLSEFFNSKLDFEQEN